MLRFLIADDHKIVRLGLSQILLEGFSDIYIEEATDVFELTDKALKSNWDLIITDIAMPGGNGIEALKKIKEKASSLAVLVVSNYSEEQYAPHALTAGADGYVNKNAVPDELVNAVTQILSGKKYISKGLFSGSE